MPVYQGENFVAGVGISPVTSVNGKVGAVSLDAGDVGARADTWLPTIDEIGAAPSGFGLGGIAKTLTATDDLNNIKTTGWYCYHSRNHPANVPTPEVYSAVMEVIFGDYSGQTVQRVYSTGDNDDWNLVAQRVFYGSGGWQPWEWVNPPMITGTSYRTTDRFNGLPVYKRKNSTNEIEWSTDQTNWYPMYYYTGAKQALDATSQELKLFGYISPAMPNGVKNYVDGNVFHRKVVRVDLGTLNWVYQPSYQSFTSNTLRGIKERSIGVCSLYPCNADNGNTQPDKSLSTYKSWWGGQITVIIKDSSYTDATAFKASVAGIYLYYELATEETYNILDADSAITRASNPNLLDNGWFSVNQRDFTSGASPDSTEWIWFADRWKCRDPAITFTRTENGVTIKNTGGAGHYFHHYMENDVVKPLAGKAVTFSIMNSNGTVVSHTFTVPATGLYYRNDAVFGEPYNLGFYFYNNINTGISGFDFRFNANAEFSIRAMKLELGSVSTLANDSAPDYATALAKCMRYYQDLRPFSTQVTAQYTTSADCIYSLPVPMRTIPTATIPTNLTNCVRELGNKNITPTSVELSSSYSSTQSVYIIVRGALTVGHNYSLAINIPISADL